MRFAIFCLGALLAGGAFADTQKIGAYQLVEVPNSQLDRYLPIGSDQTHTPRNLQGLWWMDGNPLADKLISFANLEFRDVRNAAGEVVGHQVVLPVYDQGVWTWDGSDDGLLLYKLVYLSKLTYRCDFNADYTYGAVTPMVEVGALPALDIPRSLVIDFTLTKVAPDEWRRDSVLLGRNYVYRLRRIVDGHGGHLPAWDDFQQAVESKGLANSLLPLCEDNREGQFPTDCAPKFRPH